MKLIRQALKSLFFYLFINSNINKYTRQHIPAYLNANHQEINTSQPRKIQINKQAVKSRLILNAIL